MNGLEIANKRIKEKEEITSEIYLSYAVYFMILFKATEVLLDIKFTPYDRYRALITARIVAEKKAEIILKNKNGRLE
jgi:hypothetical protein